MLASTRGLYLIATMNFMKFWKNMCFTNEIFVSEPYKPETLNL